MEPLVEMVNRGLHENKAKLVLRASKEKQELRVLLVLRE